VMQATVRGAWPGHASTLPEFVEERRGPPRLRDRPLRACYGRTPRRIRPSPCPKATLAEDCCCLR
jgi:hypothetical protein